jgi:hypothetical protein
MNDLDKVIEENDQAIELYRLFLADIQTEPSKEVVLDKLRRKEQLNGWLKDYKILKNNE